MIRGYEGNEGWGGGPGGDKCYCKALVYVKCKCVALVYFGEGGGEGDKMIDSREKVLHV